jgi:hypothetical protein
MSAYTIDRPILSPKNFVINELWLTKPKFPTFHSPLLLKQNSQALNTVKASSPETTH